ncbi:MAG: hypothetical protein WKF55_00350 [Gemmatimonadaceae bacterium]
MSLTIYGFNIILKREALDLAIKGGSESFIKRVAEPRHGTEWVSSDDNLVAVRFSVPVLLEYLVRNLLRAGLHLSKNGVFADFAIVHAQHGLDMPCDWLEYECLDEKADVWLKGTVREPSCFVPFDTNMEPFDSEVLADSPSWAERGWVTQVGRGFLLSRESDYHSWVDFNTGRVIINFLPRTSATAH